MNNEYTQEKRLIALEESPLSKDVLLLTAFSGEEEISRLFSYELDLLSKKHDIAPKDVVGKNVSFSLKVGRSATRYFSGLVSRFSASGLNVHGMRLYRAEVVPWLWFLTRSANCRIFQEKSIPQIMEQVFGELKKRLNQEIIYDLAGIKGDHPRWEYCVQYRETDFNFISRLMEQEGIFYWFRHEKGAHTLVLADQKGAYQEVFEKDVEYAAGGPETLVQSHIFSWEHEYSCLPGQWTQTDYNFENPGTSLITSTPTLVDLPNVKKFEIYDYPGEYLERAKGETLTKIRMEEEEAGYAVVSAESTCGSFTPGGKFTLKRHECASEANKMYVITSISHTATAEATYATTEESRGEYSNTFTCIPQDVTFRSARITPKPVVQGPQTAVVVGPSGEEIYTDKHGRVKLQFHWDREDKKGEDRSCWVRISQVHASKGFGGIDIPRIGDEVIVSFLEGDPDRPIVTGRVYNGDNNPPTELPSAAMISGIKSNSTPGGGGYNEMIMDDTKGNELIRIHGQHDMDSTIEHDLREHVLNDRSRDVANNEAVQIGNDRNENVDNNETIAIGANRTETVGANESISVGQNRTRKVGQNEIVTVALTRTHSVGVNEMINVGGAQEVSVGGLQAITVGATRAVTVVASQNTNIGTNMSVDVGSDLSESIGKNRSESVNDNRSSSVGKDDSLKVGKNLVIDAGDQIMIKTGKASISMKKDGTIQIQGKDITIKGSGGINVKASKNVVIKGQKVLEN